MLKKSIAIILVIMMVLVGMIGCSKKGEDLDVDLDENGLTEGDESNDVLEDTDLDEAETEGEDSEAENPDDVEEDTAEPDAEEPSDNEKEPKKDEKVANNQKSDDKAKEGPKKDATEPRTKVNSDMWVKSNVNFRKSADTSGGIIKVLSLGTKVKALEKTANGWYHIESGGGKGYVSANYLSNSEVQVAKVEPKKETPKKETPKKETPKKETPKQETPKQETPKEEDNKPEFWVPTNDEDKKIAEELAKTIVVLTAEVKPRNSKSEPLTVTPIFKNNGGGIVNPEIVWFNTSTYDPYNKSSWTSYKGGSLTASEPGNWSLKMRCTVEVYGTQRNAYFNYEITE